MYGWVDGMGWDGMECPSNMDETQTSDKREKERVEEKMALRRDKEREHTKSHKET